MVKVETPSIILAAMSALLTGESLLVFTKPLLDFTTPVFDLLTPVVAILGIPTLVILLLVVSTLHRVFEGNRLPLRITEMSRACLDIHRSFSFDE